MKQDKEYKKYLSELERTFENGVNVDSFYQTVFANSVFKKDFRSNCPWCGFDDVDVEQDMRVGGYVARCVNCGSTPPGGNLNHSVAMYSWNFGSSPAYRFILDKFAVIGAMATTGGDAEEAARLLGVTVDFINERF